MEIGCRSPPKNDTPHLGNPVTPRGGAKKGAPAGQRVRTDPRQEARANDEKQEISGRLGVALAERKLRGEGTTDDGGRTPRWSRYVSGKT